MGGNNVFMIYKKKQNIGRENKVFVVFSCRDDKEFERKDTTILLDKKTLHFLGLFFIGEETCGRILDSVLRIFFALHIYQSLID